jgi:hypothetical protein
MTTQELVERLRKAAHWAISENDHFEPELGVEAAERLSEMDAEIKRLEKERAYAVRWGEGAVESVKEVMWRYEDALKRIVEMDAHQSSSGWAMSRIARAALEHDKGEPQP